MTSKVQTSGVWETEPALQHGVANADPARLKDALISGSVGFTFSGGGFLLPYYIGCIQSLHQLNLIHPGRTHVGGSSAGSLAAAIVASDIPLEDALASIKQFMAKMRVSGIYRKLGPGLRQALEDVLPDDAHRRCSGLAHIAVTKVKPYGALRSKRVSQFVSKHDLVKALLASCHLPVLSTGALTTSFRGRRVIDGGITDLMPVPTEPKHVVKISCLTLECIKGLPMKNRPITEQFISITPCRFRTWPWNKDLTVKYMLNPGPDEVVDWLIKSGQEDVASWAYVSGITLPSPLKDIAITDVDNFKTAIANGAVPVSTTGLPAQGTPLPSKQQGSKPAAAVQESLSQDVQENKNEDAEPPDCKTVEEHAAWLQKQAQQTKSCPLQAQQTRPGVLA